ncbi:hypothetical protein B0H17DRAFT_1045136 [Mycena rosella]|uniref:Uncharacterized protein n=1 Tax=Mycena rosella TaxID=1033263 RepID=A0AAD7DYH1_MYCRO|nr:hypothetical protein B0H17DRAFT_1045136 [Mycena rosella]
MPAINTVATSLKPIENCRQCSRSLWDLGASIDLHHFIGRLKRTSERSMTLNSAQKRKWRSGESDQRTQIPLPIFHRNFLNLFNHSTIAGVVLNDESLAKDWNLLIGLKMVGDRAQNSKYDNRLFIISHIALLPRPFSDEEFEGVEWNNGDGSTVENTSEEFFKAARPHSPSPEFRSSSVHHSRQPRYHPLPRFAFIPSARHLR